MPEKARVEPQEEKPDEQPTRVEGLTAEDRARLEEMACDMTVSGLASWEADGKAISRLLAAYDHQTKALEAADEVVARLNGPLPDNIASRVRAYRSTRTTKGEDAG